MPKVGLQILQQMANQCGQILWSGGRPVCLDRPLTDDPLLIGRGGEADLVPGAPVDAQGRELAAAAVGGEGDFMAARYTASGALDASFGPPV